MVTKRVHPKAPSAPQSPISATSSAAIGSDDDQCATVLTVWRKSLLFNCSGFTVFNSDGNLAFRVDSYSSSRNNGGEIVLMDASGKPLLTSRRKGGRVFGQSRWLVYEGEGLVNVSPRFSAVKKKHSSSSSSSSKSLAYVKPCRSSGEDALGYEIEGSYAQRCCTVYSAGERGRRPLAEIRPKEAVASGAGFGADVFRLVVQPEFDATVAMATVVLLDQMFCSTN